MNRSWGCVGVSALKFLEVNCGLHERADGRRTVLPFSCGDASPQPALEDDARGWVSTLVSKCGQLPTTVPSPRYFSLCLVSASRVSLRLINS